MQINQGDRRVLPSLQSSCSPHPASVYNGLWLAMFHHEFPLVCLCSQGAVGFSEWSIHLDEVHRPAECKSIPIRTYCSLPWSIRPPVLFHRSIVASAVATTAGTLHRGTGNRHPLFTASKACDIPTLGASQQRTTRSAGIACIDRGARPAVGLVVPGIVEQLVVPAWLHRLHVVLCR